MEDDSLCPYCEADAFDVICRWCDDIGIEGDLGTFTCDECGKRFRAESKISVTLKLTKLTNEKRTQGEG